MIQAHVYFSGMVQGVGFRYAVQRYASESGLCGWVRNLPDGRVEMKAEGVRNLLEDLLSRIEAHFNGSISEKQVYWDDNLEHFENFKIAF